MTLREVPPIGSTTLMIDFSNGVVTTMSRVALDAKGGLWATLAMPSLDGKQTEVTFEEGMTDRGSNHHTRIAAVDGVAAVADETAWSIWVNDRPAGTAVSYHMQGMPGSGNPVPAVDDGDFVLIKLERVSQEKTDTEV